MSGRRVSEVDVYHVLGGGGGVYMSGEMGTCYVNISFTETKKIRFVLFHLLSFRFF